MPHASPAPAKPTTAEQLPPGTRLEDYVIAVEHGQRSCDPENDACPVCLQGFERPYQPVGRLEFPCGHGTCLGCLKKLCRLQRLKSNCPLCRACIVRPAADSPGLAVVENPEPPLSPKTSASLLDL